MARNFPTSMACSQARDDAQCIYSQLSQPLKREYADRIKRIEDVLRRCGKALNEIAQARITGEDIF